MLERGEYSKDSRTNKKLYHLHHEFKIKSALGKEPKRRYID